MTLSRVRKVCVPGAITIFLLAAFPNVFIFIR